MNQKEYTARQGSDFCGLSGMGNWERLHWKGEKANDRLNLMGNCNSLIQRFTEENDGRLSKNRSVFVSNEGNLYAGAGKVSEGNQALAAAPVKLEADTGNLHELPAVKVVPDVKETLLPEQQILEPEVVAAMKEDCLTYKTAIDEGLASLGESREKIKMTALLDSLIVGFEARSSEFSEQACNIRYALEEEKLIVEEEGITEVGAEILIEKIRRLSVYLTQAAMTNKLFLPSDCGLFAGMMMGVPEKDQMDEEEEETYKIGLQSPDERVRLLAYPILGGSYYITGEKSEKEVAYHWGMIVMRDDEDTVTMEGAVAPATDFPKMEQDNTWYFAMQGGLEGFKEENKHYFKNETVTDSGIYQKEPMEAEIIQRVYQYNPIWDRIEYVPCSDQDIQQPDYISVEGNEYKVWSPPEWAVHVRNMLKIQEYREEMEMWPWMGSRMNPVDARGIGKMASISLH